MAAVKIGKEQPVQTSLLGLSNNVSNESHLVLEVCYFTPRDESQKGFGILTVDCFLVFYQKAL